MNKILQGDCLETLKTLPDNSIDAIVTDPPYGLSFMGKKWDYDVPKTEIWKEAFRVLKPGGYLLSFAGTRTQHRMAVNIEDAGFEIRDMIAWVYGSGFPKSLNIGKAVDKLQGNEREVVGQSINKSGIGNVVKGHYTVGGTKAEYTIVTKGTSEWEGWGTALKPALEPITVARKPISEKTVAENCLKWGVGGINIDGCRVETTPRTTHKDGNYKGSNDGQTVYGKYNEDYFNKGATGRFPANLIHDGSDEVVGLFPNDSARFFYCPKASKAERNKGCEGLEEKAGIRTNAPRENEDIKTPTRTNNHPTVKPIALMEYLIKLVSKEGHTILDPFAGSGSTLIAAKKLKRNYIGCELDPEYIKIAEARLSAVKTDNKLF